MTLEKSPSFGKNLQMAGIFHGHLCFFLGGDFINLTSNPSQLWTSPSLGSRTFRRQGRQGLRAHGVQSTWGSGGGSTSGTNGEDGRRPDEILGCLVIFPLVFFSGWGNKNWGEFFLILKKKSRQYIVSIYSEIWQKKHSPKRTTGRHSSCGRLRFGPQKETIIFLS